MLVSVSGRRCVGAESVALCFMRGASYVLQSFRSCRGIVVGWIVLRSFHPVLQSELGR